MKYKNMKTISFPSTSHSLFIISQPRYYFNYKINKSVTKCAKIRQIVSYPHQVLQDGGRDREKSLKKTHPIFLSDVSEIRALEDSNPRPFGP